MELIETVPVVHGCWIIHTDKFSPMQRCSSCGFEIPVVATDREEEIYLYRYCPSCGARMDKTADEI